MAGAPYQRKPGVAVKAATKKRKLRAYVTQPRLILLAMEIRERRRAATADPALSFADTFATLQELARELVDLCAAHLNNPDMHFTPINIGENEWGPEGLLGFWVALGGHFETLNLGLFGVLRALQENADGFNLKSRVWGLLDTALGRTSFNKMVIFNIVCFAAPFDVGEAIMDSLPPEVCEELNQLQVAALNSLGTPAKFAGFGGAVSLAGDRGLAQVGHAHISFPPDGAAHGELASGVRRLHSWPASPAVRDNIFEPARICFRGEGEWRSAIAGRLWDPDLDHSLSPAHVYTPSRTSR